MNLFAFDFSFIRDNINDAVNKKGALDSLPPLLRPVSNNSSSMLNGKQTGIKPINVVKDFNWTYSPKGEKGRAEVPYVLLTEKRLKTNALASQLKYSFGGAIQGVSNVSKYVQSLGSNANSFVNTIRKYASKASESISSAGNAIGGSSEELQSIARDLTSQLSSDDKELQDYFLRSYQDLYITEMTSFKYYLPYFDDYLNSAQNVFGDGEAGPGLGLLRTLSDMAVGIGDVLGVAQAPLGFSFQERAKFYNFPQDGEEISFSFPLINTGSSTYDDVLMNWQLIFLLLYQNKPARLTRSVIEPPVIYSLYIPGQKYLPYCYLKNLTVQFKGSRREMPISIPIVESEFIQSPQDNSFYNAQNITDNTNIPNVTQVATGNSFNTTAIIPDAYMLTFTFQSMVCETRNFLAYVLSKQAARSRITVSNTQVESPITGSNQDPANTASTEQINKQFLNSSRGVLS